jgi:serine/threonine protein kinase
MISNLTATISGISFISFVCVTGWFALRRRKHVTSWKMIPFGTLDFTEQDIIGNISEENVIGRGGSGKVYRIHLGSHNHKAGGHGGDGGAGHSTTTTVAVKKIGKDGKPDANNDKEFEAEARSLGGLLHRNIVRLLCCISGDDTKLLVYEYMENGSLDRWLHRRGGKRAATLGPLDWPTRLSIAIDVATGLSYMHHGFTSPIIHRDIKCSNILLDRGFRAKIADFGLARILTKSGESEPVSAVCGTFGYIAPGDYNSAALLHLLCKHSMRGL